MLHQHLKSKSHLVVDSRANEYDSIPKQVPIHVRSILANYKHVMSENMIPHPDPVQKSSAARKASLADCMYLGMFSQGNVWRYDGISPLSWSNKQAAPAANAYDKAINIVRTGVPHCSSWRLGCLRTSFCLSSLLDAVFDCCANVICALLLISYSVNYLPDLARRRCSIVSKYWVPLRHSACLRYSFLSMKLQHKFA